MADIVRVLSDASAGLCLHHQDFLPKSLSAHEALFFRRCRRDISEAHFHAAAGHAGDSGSSLYKTLYIPSKAAVLSGGLLFGSRPARSLLFSRWFSGLLARARPQPQNAAIYGVLLYCVSRLACGLLFLGCSFWGLWRARARPHVSLLGWGPAGAQKASIPGIIWGWGGQHA